MLQVSLIFVARFILTPQAERNAGEFLSYDPIVLLFFFLWRNYHLSPGQYLPIMLQA